MTDYPWYQSYPEGIPHTINPDKFASLPGMLDSVAAQFPNRIGYSNMGVGLTYSKTAALSKDLAAYLQSLEGMKPGDRFNDAEPFAVHSGCLRLSTCWVRCREYQPSLHLSRSARIVGRF